MSIDNVCIIVCKNKQINIILIFVVKWNHFHYKTTY